MNKLNIFLAALLCVASAKADGVARLSPRTSSLLKASERVDRDTDLQVYLTVDPVVLDRDALKRHGVRVSLNLGSTLTARVPMHCLEALSQVPGVLYIQASTPVSQALDVAASEVGMVQVHAGSSLPQAYNGSGVVVGIVDSGFDYAHEAFRDADGALRIKCVWEQSTEPFGNLSSPLPFGYGTLMTDASDILSAGADRQNNSHGSHVTSIAAGGSMLSGSLSGMAPDADIVLVSMQDAGANNVCVSDAIAFIFGYADVVGKPCVVNLSLASNSGPHDGTSTFDRIADSLQGPGRLIVGASGNYRADKFHLRHDFAAADDEPLRTFVDFKSSYSYRNDGEIDLWASPEMDITVNLLAYKLSSNEVVERVQIYPAADAQASVSLGRNIAGSFEVASEVCPLNGKPHVGIISRVTSVRTGYAVAIEAVPASGGYVDVWADDRFLGFESKDVPGFREPSDDPTICEIGGTASRILSVGAYTTRSEYVRLGESDSYTLNETVGALCSFSGGGPTADGRMKPQVAAPGCFISGAVSSFDNSGTITFSGFDDLYGHNNYYGYMQGTSMAAPFVTGIVATWLQAWPEMTPEDLVEVVRISARHDAFTSDVANNDWGYGKIDALAGIRECIERSGSGSVGSVVADAQQPVVISYDGTGLLHVMFAAAAADAEIALYSVAGTKAYSLALGDVQPSDAVVIDVASLPSGVYALVVASGSQRTVTKFVK